jgi:quercetin 2,3-dioxygenase
MSGPVRTEDVRPDAEPPERPEPPGVEVVASHEARVGGARVLRALPRRGHRTVGAWCFADHLVPSATGGPGIGPHPHIGLQTVTWVLDGEMVHTDSLGTRRTIRPGQLNLMTAGRGVAHAEEPPPGTAGASHLAQLWVAQPEATRHGPPAFEHHPELPVVTLGAGTATVLVGTLAGITSPARRDTNHVGAEVVLRDGTSAVPVEPSHEHALVVLEGAVTVDGTTVTPGHLAYLGLGRSELVLGAAGGPGASARLLVLGGVPFPDRLVMWWNFVARTHDEVDEARAAWQSGPGDERFGTVASTLDRIAAPPTPWTPR